MKTILLFLLMLPILVLSQDRMPYKGKITMTDSTWTTRVDTALNIVSFGWKIIPKETMRIYSGLKLGIRETALLHRASIKGDENQELNIDFKGDSMIVTGNLNYNDAACKFLDALSYTYRSKIDSLKNKNLVLQEKLNAIYKVIQECYNITKL